MNVTLFSHAVVLLSGEYMYRFIQSIIRSGYTLLLACSFTMFISLTFSTCV